MTGNRYKPSRWKYRTTLLATTSCVVALGLSGCLLSRVSEVRNQFCEFEQNFEIEFGDQPSIRMNQPVMLDQDILWLTGAMPTETVLRPNGKTMTWVIEEAVTEPDPDNDLRLDLDFRQIDGEYKLSLVRMDPKFNAVMNPDYLDRETLLSTARDVCNTGLGFSMRSMEFDIPDQDIEQLPSRPEVLEMMGLPHDPVTADGGWTYRYRLKGSNDESQTAQFTVWFDEVSLRPLKMESHYSRYRTSADFVSRKLSMNVKL